MNAMLLLVCAVAPGLAVALCLGILSMGQSRRLYRTAHEQAAADLEQLRAANEPLASRLEGLDARIRELESQMASSPAGVTPRPALNLTRRSHALRMHRQGHPPEHIAAVLEIPLQEVHLLLKVHRLIVGKL